MTGKINRHQLIMSQCLQKYNKSIPFNDLSYISVEPQYHFLILTLITSEGKRESLIVFFDSIQVEMREFTLRFLILQDFTLSLYQKVLGDQLGANDWVNLKIKLKPCYPDDEKTCQVKNKTEFQLENVQFKICSQSRQNEQAKFLDLVKIKNSEKFNVNPVENFWGRCENGNSNCIYGGGLGSTNKGDLNRFVGTETLEDLAFGCNCKGLDKYGPYCNWDEPQAGERDFCGFGKYNISNFLSGCECRDKLTNEPVPYHGWYCDIHNRALCDKSKSTQFHGKFYDVTTMKDKVGDCCSSVCKDCDKIIKNCGECKQDEENNCK